MICDDGSSVYWPEFDARRGRMVHLHVRARFRSMTSARTITSIRVRNNSIKPAIVSGKF